MLCYILRRRCRDGCKSDVDGKVIALLTSEIGDEPLFYGSNVLIRLHTSHSIIQHHLIDLSTYTFHNAIILSFAK